MMTRVIFLKNKKNNRGPFHLKKRKKKKKRTHIRPHLSQKVYSMLSNYGKKNDYQLK